jgi:hypothetical protein
MTLVNIALVVSLILNVFFIWYMKKILEKLLFVSDNIGGLYDSVIAYGSYLESIFELETYHGDDTIQAMINNTREIREELKEFEQIYSLTDVDEDEEGETDDIEDEENAP